MIAKKLPLIIALVLIIAPSAGAKNKAASLKRPTYSAVQMQLQPIVYHLATNARRLEGIRMDLLKLAERNIPRQTEATDMDSVQHIHQISHSLVELALRTEHQVELMELVVFIQIESKHDFFMRRLDQLYLAKEIGQEIISEIDRHVPKIQNNAALRLIERSKFIINNSLEQFDNSIKIITALEPVSQAKK
ncbi:MAG: hypothetical protein JEZ11_23165 [Desulfobacterales bacterium]|nr:hypothetical protein [Desulfobacterales bacterium]